MRQFFIKPCEMLYRMLKTIAEPIKERIWLGLAIGVALWLAWLGSISLGERPYDRFGQLICTDHIAFLSAAKLIDEKRESEIYHLPSLAQIQIEMVGERWKGKYEAYRNPPFYALLYWPTVKLGYSWSAFLWSMVSLLVIAIAIRLITIGTPEMPMPSLARRAHENLWCFCFPPAFYAISYGQNTPLSVLILAITYRLMKSNHLFTAGLVAGVLAFKPTLLIGLIIWGLIDIGRLWKCALGVAVSIALLSGVSWLIIPDAWSAFFESLNSNASFDNMDWWKNLSPRAFWRLLLGPSATTSILSILTAFAGIAFFAKVLWSTNTNPNRLDILFPLSVVLMLWVTPHAMQYEWLLLIVPALIAWTSQPGQRDELRLLFAMTFVISLLGPIASQLQLRYLPFAIHAIVPIAGGIAILFAKCLEAKAKEFKNTSPP